jgi:phosphoribosyl-ATP pyrophosphohydrolase
LDCDRDTIRFTVHQNGAGTEEIRRNVIPIALIIIGFCHENTWTCFGEDEGIGKLMRTLHARKASAPPGSYTKRLFEDAKLLESKILEEAHELVEASSKEHITAEAADVMYGWLISKIFWC